MTKLLPEVVIHHCARTSCVTGVCGQSDSLTRVAVLKSLGFGKQPDVVAAPAQGTGMTAKQMSLRQLRVHCTVRPDLVAAPMQGTGMTAKQMGLCDSFVYIPQYGAGTASLNVTVAASILLQHFAVWAGYAERERAQHKFVVAAKPERTTARGAPGASRYARVLST